MTLQGRLDACATVATLSSYVWTLFALFRRTGQIDIPKDVRAQTMAYLASADLGDHVALSTKRRDKHYASTVDVRRLVDAYHADTTHFRTNRMRLQMSALTTLLAISAERIGAIVESNCYRGSNACLKWKDVDVVVIPRPDAPETPDVALRVTVHLLKGGRDVDAFRKAFFLFPEYGTDRAYCPVVPLLVLGLWDGVWEGVRTPEDVFRPSVAPSAVHVLRVVPSKADRPVFRSEERTGAGWAVSDDDDKAMNYGAACRHLRYFSRRCGFPGALPRSVAVPATRGPHTRTPRSHPAPQPTSGRTTSVEGRPT